MKPYHFALLGGDLSYSRSPEIFRTIFNQLGCEGRFDLCPTRPDHLGETLKDMVKNGVTGFSVTIPHKQAMIGHLDWSDDLVKATESVNSVAVIKGTLRGYNTDCYGFSFALKKAGFEGCERAVIIGSGGAARAVVHTLAVDFGVRDFVLCGRHSEKLSYVKSIFKEQIQYATVQTVTDLHEMGSHVTAKSILVNCTPLGGPLFPEVSPVPPGLDWGAVSLYVDLNYNSNNQTVNVANEAGASAIDGSSMLVAQALKSMELWTGVSVEYEPVYTQVFQSQHQPESDTR